MKTFRSRSWILAVASMGLLAGSLFPAAPALAANDPVITGIQVVSWDGGPFLGSPDFVVDGSGLTRPDFSGLHAPANASNSMACNHCYKSADPSVVLRGVIDLQGAYRISSAGVWQYTGSDPLIVAGARSVTFKTSMDGVNFESVPGATVDLAPGISGAFSEARVATFSAPARYVMVESATVFREYWGLSEVMFTGTPLAVPEPASFGLMGAGLALLGAWRRRAVACAVADVQ